MPSEPFSAERAKTSALLPSGYTPRNNYGWVDLSCGKRCLFARVPWRDEDLQNYIEIMDAFGRDIPKRYEHMLFWAVDPLGTTQESSMSSKPANPEGRITVIFSTELGLQQYDAQIAHIYYNGDIPGAKYDSHSDSSTFNMTLRVCEVIMESGDEPLFPQPNTVGTATITPICTTINPIFKTHPAFQSRPVFKPHPASKPHKRNTAQLHPKIQPRPKNQQHPMIKSRPMIQANPPAQRGIEG